MPVKLKGQEHTVHTITTHFVKEWRDLGAVTGPIAGGYAHILYTTRTAHKRKAGGFGHGR
jgi:hypothetical protein